MTLNTFSGSAKIIYYLTNFKLAMLSARTAHTPCHAVPLARGATNTQDPFRGADLARLDAWQVVTTWADLS